MKRCLLTAVFVTLALGRLAHGQFGTDDLGLGSPTDPAATAQPLEVSALSQYEAVTPGQTFLVALTVDIDPEYYFYSPAPGSTEEIPVTPAGLQVQAEGFEHVRTLWPPDTPTTLDVGGLTARNNVYKGRIVVFARFRAAENAPETPAEILLQLTGQVCSKGGVCIPLDRFTDPSATRARLTPAFAQDSRLSPAWADLGDPQAMLERALTARQLRESRPQETDQEAIVVGGLGDMSIWAALGLALLVGLTLNIMPCVLPVIPLRIYSIVNMAGESRRRVVGLGLAFAFGILLFFLILAGFNAGLNIAAQQALDWSAMWKYPLMRSGMIVLLVIVAANLFGLFTVTVPNKVAQIEAQNKTGGGYVSSIGMGLMMAILSTPCSFGLLLGVLGWSQTQPLAVATLVFTFMGLGMALPHALLVAYPKLLEKLPKPGMWMEHFKQSMGFIVLLVGAYLLHTLTESPYAAWVAAFAIILSAGLWVWDKWVKYTDPMGKKLLVRGTTVAVLILAGIWMLQPPRPGQGVEFVEYDDTVLSQARQDDRPVLLKFTASWCTSCKTIERKVFSKPAVADYLARRNVLPVEVDVTNNDSPGDKFMRRRYGTGAPPLTVLLPAGEGRAVQLLGSYDIEQLKQALERAGIDETPAATARGS